MKSYKILITLLFLANSMPEPSLRSLSSYVNPLTRVRLYEVDKALNSLPPRTSVTMENMINQMNIAGNSYGLAHCEVVYMVYKWIAYNIAFDCYNYVHNPSYLPIYDYDVYNQGKGGDEGIANLFNTMVSKAFQLPAAILRGYSKVTNYQGKLPSQPDHIWNGINFEGGSYLIDVAWGMGECYSDRFNPAFSNFYFCNDPEVFIRSHFPLQSEWQLVYPAKTEKEFINMLKLTKNFYENGFKSISPDKATITAESDGKFFFEITHEQVPKQFSITLFYPKDNSYQQENNACWVNKNPTSAEITCFANYKGSNKLYIYGGTKGQDPLPFLLEYDVYVTKNGYDSKEAPILMKDFLQGRDIYLTQPLDNPLTRSKFYTFKIKSADFSNMYIYNNDPYKGNSHLRELDYKAGGVFSGDYVYIFGTEVYIVTYQNGNYYQIVKYKTIRNSNQVVDATFPRSYAAPKNTLYSPVLDKLEINKRYKFEIKCESCMRILVKNDKYYELNKSNSVFSGYITIQYSGDNIVEIQNCNASACSPMYYYWLSN